MTHAYSFNSTYYQRTLSQSVAPQFSHSYQPLRSSVAPHFNHFERTLSLSAALQFQYHHRTSSVSFAPQFYHYNSTVDSFKPAVQRLAQEQAQHGNLVEDAMSNVDEQKFRLKQEADRVLESARKSNLNPYAEPFISQQTKTTVETNSLKTPPTSSLNPNAIPFFSSSKSSTHGSNFESIW
jgi:hypothetical protein